MNDGTDRTPTRRRFVKSGAVLSLPMLLMGCSERPGSSNASGTPSSHTTPADERSIVELLPHSRYELHELVNSYILPELDSERDAIVDHLRIKDAMQAIGQAYLDDFSDDRRRRGVVDEVSHTLEKIDIDESTQGIRKQLFSEIRTDFESEDLTAVGGWWLATTEVHICTVASLLEE